MSWMILNTEPAYGICDQCKQHTCGIVDGQHKWVQTGIYDRSGDAIVIGYGCVELWAANLGISREIVVKEQLRPPTEEEMSAYLRNLIAMVNKKAENMTRDEMKTWLDQNGISYFKGITDDKLRELVNQHV